MVRGGTTMLPYLVIKSNFYLVFSYIYALDGRICDHVPMQLRFGHGQSVIHASVELLQGIFIHVFFLYFEYLYLDRIGSLRLCHPAFRVCKCPGANVHLWHTIRIDFIHCLLPSPVYRYFVYYICHCIKGGYTLKYRYRFLVFNDPRMAKSYEAHERGSESERLGWVQNEWGNNKITILNLLIAYI